MHDFGEIAGEDSYKPVREAHRRIEGAAKAQAARRESTAAVAANASETALMELGDVISLLEGILEPVLRPRGPEVERDGSAAQPPPPLPFDTRGSPFFAAYGKGVLRLRAMTEHLRTLANRLDV